MRPSLGLVIVAALAGMCWGGAVSPAAGPDQPDVDALLQHLDDLYRSKSRIARIQIDVTSPRSIRSMRLRAWMGTNFTNDDLVKESSLRKLVPASKPSSSDKGSAARTPDDRRYRISRARSAPFQDRSICRRCSGLQTRHETSSPGPVGRAASSRCRRHTPSPIPAAVRCDHPVSAPWRACRRFGS